jgi:hypothetical protein
LGLRLGLNYTIEHDGLVEAGKGECAAQKINCQIGVKPRRPLVKILNLRATYRRVEQFVKPVTHKNDTNRLVCHSQQDVHSPGPLLHNIIKKLKNVARFKVDPACWLELSAPHE